jgi:hypothetical protein
MTGLSLQIGDLDDGGIYVGPSAKDGKPLHAALADEPEYMTHDQVYEAAEQMRKQPGRENAHVGVWGETEQKIQLSSMSHGSRRRMRAVDTG